MAATPVVSTPTTAASPPTIAPALGAAPQIKSDSSTSPAPSGSSFASPIPGQGTSVTTRQWVVPPRPKPGRKPATDTPPTKRKAQNRAAQRAFRERRAARVGELEDQLKKVEEDHESEQCLLKVQIDKLTHQLEKYQQDISWWETRCHSLEEELAQGRAATDKIRQPSQHYQSPTSNTANSSAPAAEADDVPINIRRSNKRKITPESTSISGTLSLHSTTSSTQRDSQGGCGSCSFTKCQCIEDAFNLSKIVEDHSSPSQSRHLRSPNARSSPQRHQHDASVKADPEQMEIDFTSRFAISRDADQRQRATSSPPTDRCGFCEDGTVCFCAEVAEYPTRSDPLENNRLAPIQNLSQFTPPPSDGDVRAEVTLPPISQATNPCTNGPGTCAQCLADPQSTLFCKSLAASRKVRKGGGCCGGQGDNSSSCQARPRTRNDSSRAATASASSPTEAPNLTLTCADTYATLSRHPQYSRAADEIGSWVPILNTFPRGSSSHDVLPNNISNRPALEVEAASVMGVLRYFDRRFVEK